MTQYIDKDALVAEIERYKHKADERLKIKGRTLAEDCKDSALQNLCGNLLHFIDTLEVREVEEEPISNDLEREIKHYVYDPYFDLNGVAVKGATDYLTVEDVADIARHFAQWQKEQLIEKACVFLKSTDFYKYYNREFVKEFVKAMEK